MRVVNESGYLHKNITALSVEENCRLTGRGYIFHRIWGYDEDSRRNEVLDWGMDLEDVVECYELMSKQLSKGQAGYWDCTRSGLNKDYERQTA